MTVRNRSRRPFSAAAALGLASVLLLGAAPGAGDIEPYGGQALDIERDFAKAYVEENRDQVRDGRLVATRSLYKDDAGKVMAERDLDFTRSPYKPAYVFRDHRKGYEEGSRVEGERLYMYFRDSARAPLKEKRLKVPEPCVVNGGFNQFLKARWEELEAGKRVQFNMAIPARLDFYRFVAYLDSTLNPPARETGGRTSKTVVVAPQSAVLRLVLSPIVISYDTETLRMVRYQGIVNVADAKGRSLRVRVDYPGRGP